jgi:hypothetical protein
VKESLDADRRNRGNRPNKRKRPLDIALLEIDVDLSSSAAVDEPGPRASNGSSRYT